MKSSLGRWSVLVLVLGAGCTRGEELDPADLTARDLLGLDPRIAIEWSDAERDDAHQTFDAAFRAVDPDGELTEEITLDEALAAFPEVAVARGLDAADVGLDSADQPPRLAVRADADADAAMVTELALGGLPEVAGTPTPIVLIGWDAGAADGWDALPRRVPGFLVALAEAAGRAPTAGPLEVVPAPRVGFAAAWLEGADRLLVNPVLLAALDAEPGASSYPISAGGSLAWASGDTATSRDDVAIAGGAAADDGEALWVPGGDIDAGPDASPPPPSGGESCDGPACDGPDCGGCEGGTCNDGACGDGGGCNDTNNGGMCGVANNRRGSTVAWFLIPLLLLRRWRLRERKQARRACDPD
jgi:hypothetical protein